MTEPDRKRQCFYIPPDQFDEHGYIPSLITEGERGHAPLKGDGPLASPWYWGKTYGAACDEAKRQNERAFGLREGDVAEIILSSIRATPRRGDVIRHPRQGDA